MAGPGLGCCLDTKEIRDWSRPRASWPCTRSPSCRVRSSRRSWRSSARTTAAGTRCSSSTNNNRSSRHPSPSLRHPWVYTNLYIYINLICTTNSLTMTSSNHQTYLEISQLLDLFVNYQTCCLKIWQIPDCLLQNLAITRPITLKFDNYQIHYIKICQY